MGKWKRIMPTTSQTGQVQAVQAKKHLTVFIRKPGSPGAGRADIKKAFAECAHETLGIPSRLERMEKVKECVKKKGLKTGIYRKKSRAKPGSPLYGRVYVAGKLE